MGRFDELCYLGIPNMMCISLQDRINYFFFLMLANFTEQRVLLRPEQSALANRSFVERRQSKPVQKRSDYSKPRRFRIYERPFFPVRYASCQAKKVLAEL